MLGMEALPYVRVHAEQGRYRARGLPELSNKCLKNKGVCRNRSVRKVLAVQGKGPKFNPPDLVFFKKKKKPGLVSLCNPYRQETGNKLIAGWLIILCLLSDFEAVERPCLNKQGDDLWLPRTNAHTRTPRHPYEHVCTHTHKRRPGKWLSWTNVCHISLRTRVHIPSTHRKVTATPPCSEGWE